MEVINDTRLQFSNIMGRLNFPKYSLTMIIKGTFDLNSKNVAMPVEKQLLPTGDEFFSDDIEMQGSCRYESDFAYFKPKADLLLSGHCHSPNNEPIQACQAKFQVGAHEKTLNIFGDRKWKRSLGIRTITDPEPFTKMELRYENSFGGQGYKKNPVGKGFSEQETSDGKKVLFLPNIEDPENMIGSPRNRPEPAGFGPLGKMWEQRSSKMGTYKGKYLKKRWPWFAEDFDYGYFNSAPPDMQVEGYLRGDEELYFKNLHPEHSRFVSKLPGIRIRFFINKQVNPESDETDFQEVSMKLDTLWADMDNDKLVLVWRGVTEVQSEEYEELLHSFIISEPLVEQPASLEKCQEMFLAAIAEDKKEIVGPEEPEEQYEEPEIKTSEDENPIESKPELPKKEDLKKFIKAQTSMILAEFGINLDNLPPGIKERSEKDQERILDRLLETDPEKKMAMEQAEQKAEISESLSKLGIDMDNLPPLNDKAKKEQFRLFAELGMTDPGFLQSPEMVSLMGIMGALMPKMGIDPEKLDPFIAEAKNQQKKMKKQLGIEDKEESPEEEKPIKLTREIVKERAERHESFAGEDFRGIDLSELDLKGIDFAGANLTGVLLSNSDLSSANLTNAYMSETDLSGSNLTGIVIKGGELTRARLPGAILKKADLSDSKLENAVLTNADLSNGNFSDVNLAGADLTEADITESTMQKADLSGTNLANAILKGSDISGADLTAANVKGADISEGNLTGAVLSEANMEGVNLTGANLPGADMKKVDLKNACLKEADFTEADMTGVDLCGSDLSEAIFEKTKLAGATLAGVQAIDANFSEADLTGANLSRSDFSKADFSKSILNETDFRESKLEDTSVEGARGIKVNFTKADLTRLRASEGCDFTEAKFREAKGFESIWHNAVLKNADFVLSEMQGADFTKADLQNADFSASNMKYTRFMKADMKLTKLLYMNLFEGNLEKSNLTGADLTGSNMYGVEFLGAILDHTKMENTNLKMTKLV